MVRSVKDRGEVILNNIKFKLGGDSLVHLFYASKFAEKQVIGDYTKESDPNRSTWAFYADQSGGIGVEDLRKPSHVNRAWWSTINTNYPGSGFLGKLATTISLDSYPGHLLNGGFEDFTGANPDNWTESDPSAVMVFSEETSTIDSGSSALKIVFSGNSNWDGASQTISWHNNYRSKAVTFTARIKGSAAASANSQARLAINDGIDTTTGAAIQPDNTSFQTMTVTKTLAANATSFSVYIQFYTNTTTPTFYCDTAFLKTPYTGDSLKSVEFNGSKYLATGNNLWELNGTGDGFTLLAFFKSTITDVIASVNSCLYIFLGDIAEYQYMTTAEAFTETDVANAYYGVHWDNKLVKINSSGATSYAATPNAASPTWTANGTLDTGTWGTIRGLVTYADSSGSDVIYGATTKGLLAYDYVTGSGTGLWLNTELQVPKHTDNGKGFTVQNGAIYYSAGLSVYEYKLISGSLIIRNVGLDQDDGLPDEYVGSITCLFNGYEGDMYALVDASLISSSNFSSVARYRNGAWSVIWADGTANETMAAGFASSVYDYRLWFSAAGVITYVTLDRARRNPLKTTSTYAVSSMYVSPWTDLGWAGDKLALATRLLARGTSANETIKLYYRIDKATTNIVASTAGWTLHDTLVAADAGVESVIAFASSAGVSHKTIQFRADFARAAGTTTLTPNLIYGALEYEKIISPKWGWAFTLDCSETYANRTPVQQRDELITIVESSTLIPFYYGGPSEPRYVRVKPAEGERLSGQASIGQYRLVAVEK